MKNLGYYNLALENGEYSISNDVYRSDANSFHYDISYGPVTRFELVIIPKDVISYVDGVQKIAINKNEITRTSYWSMGNGENVEFPQDVSSWVLKPELGLYEKYGLNIGDAPFADLYMNYLYELQNERLIFYLPNEPTCDCIVSKAEIKNGDLYLTVEAYTNEVNTYLRDNEVYFYDLIIEDTSLLSDNYNVYITVNKVTPLIL